MLFSMKEKHGSCIDMELMRATLGVLINTYNIPPRLLIGEKKTDNMDTWYKIFIISFTVGDAFYALASVSLFHQISK